MYTVDHTCSYRGKKFIHVCAKSSAHAHSTEIRGGNWKLLETIVGLAGNGQIATDSQGRIRSSDGNPRTGMLHQTQVTMGDTACNVNGVYTSGNVIDVAKTYETDSRIHYLALYSNIPNLVRTSFVLSF